MTNPKRHWMLYRAVLFVAAASLAVYIPFKYLTQPHAMTALYGFLFPLSSVLAVGGMLLAIRPGAVFRAPFLLRAPVGGIAAAWMATGLLCIPSLTQYVLQSPFGGSFATFHMLVQHVVLSVMLGTLVVAPRVTYAYFGLPPEPGERRIPGFAPEKA